METGLIPNELANITCVEPPISVPGLFPLACRSVHIIENLNPFRPEDKRVIEIDPLDNESLAAIVTRVGLHPEDYECSLNGGLIPTSEIWATAVSCGNDIVLFPRTAGGAAKSMLAILGGIVACLAVGLAMFFCPALVPFVLANWNIVVGGCFLGGEMLTAYLLQPGQPSPASYSTTYDPTGPKGLARPGVPVPKAYGTFGWCGNIVSSYVSFAGPKAYINALVSYGWGIANNIASPLLNNQNISNFADCSYQTRLGSNTQAAIDGFDSTVNGYPQDIELLVANGHFVVSGTGTNVQGLEITVKFPRGLYCVTADGNYVTCHFIYSIEVAPHDSNDWTMPLFPNMANTSTVASFHSGDTYETWPAWVVIPTDQFAGSGLVYASDNGTHTPGDPWTSTESVTTINPDGSSGSTSHTFQGVWQPCDPNTNPVLCSSWFQGFVHVQNYTTSAIFDTQCIYGLTPGQWDVRVTKICYYQDQHLPIYSDSTDAQHVADGWLWNINELFWSNLTYPNMVLLGVKALATEQMSGANIQIMATITHDIGADTVLPAALAIYEHDNPAIVAYDVLTNPTYGMGVLPVNIDVPAFVAWADFNDELVTNQNGSQVRRHIFAGVFDQTSDAWKTLQTIGNMSRAALVPLGMRYTVILDAPADPVQLFTVGNVKKDSFKEEWLSLDERATLIECAFADAARNYRMDLPVSAMTAADMNSGLEPKIARTQLIGCTSRDQAWRWAYHQLISTKLSLRTIQFSAPIEAVCCKIGSVIAFQSDVTQWGVGGRVQPGSTLTTLNIERTDLTFAPAAGWTVSVQHPVVNLGTAQVSSTSSNGSIVYTAAPLPLGRILKAVGPDGTEYTVNSYGGSALTLSGPSSLVSGQTITLYDQGMIECLNVLSVVTTPASSSGSGGAVITVSGSFSAVPSTDSSWAYGQSAGGQPAKLFRVISIKQSGDFNFDLVALEYNAVIYEDVVPNYGQIVGVPDSTPAIINLTLSEQYQNGTLTGSSNSSIVSVGWQNSNTAVGAQVQVQAAGGPWNTIGNIQGQGCTFVGTIGVAYNVRVTGFDWQSNLVGTPVTASITVQASTNAPAAVTGFNGYATLAQNVLFWTPVSGADHYEIRYAAQGAASWNTAVVLWDGTGTTWTDSALRTGVYMIVAVSSLATGSLESVSPANCQIAASSQLNYSSFAAFLNTGTISASGRLTFSLPAGNVYTSSGQEISLGVQTIQYPGTPTPGTSYYGYAFLDASGILHAIPDPGSVSLPDLAPNPTHAAAAAAAGIANAIIIWTTPSTGGGGGSGVTLPGNGPNKPPGFSSY
jgi:predicted phage tail protein